MKLNGEEVKLSPKEYDILRLLVQHAGKVLTHHFILNQVWGLRRTFNIFASMFVSYDRRLKSRQISRIIF